MIKQRFQFSVIQHLYHNQHKLIDSNLKFPIDRMLVLICIWLTLISTLADAYITTHIVV